MTNSVEDGILDREGGREPSLVRLNAERDPSYLPYCMRCKGLVRMSKVEDFYWRCLKCDAEHDERGTG